MPNEPIVVKAQALSYAANISDKTDVIIRVYPTGLFDVVSSAAGLINLRGFTAAELETVARIIIGILTKNGNIAATPTGGGTGTNTSGGAPVNFDINVQGLELLINQNNALEGLITSLNTPV